MPLSSLTTQPSPPSWICKRSDAEGNEPHELMQENDWKQLLAHHHNGVIIATTIITFNNDNDQLMKSTSNRVGIKEIDQSRSIGVLSVDEGTDTRQQSVLVLCSSSLGHGPLTHTAPSFAWASPKQSQVIVPNHSAPTHALSNCDQKQQEQQQEQQQELLLLLLLLLLHHHHHHHHHHRIGG